MAPLDPCSGDTLPRSYKQYRLVPGKGRVYGVPSFLDDEELERTGKLAFHPAVLSAANRDDLRELIDRRDGADGRPELLGTCEGHELVHYCGQIHGVPLAAGPVDLDREEDCRRAGVVSGKTAEEVVERIRATLHAVPVEFAGWLPIFRFSANCGTHPQFRHTADPPPGYRFSYSAPPPVVCRPSLAGRAARWVRNRAGRVLHGTGVALRPLLGFFKGGPHIRPRTRLRVLAALARLFFTLLGKGVGLRPALRFLRSRHFQSQLLIADSPGLVFLTSMPYTYNQNPWVVEIEDPTTLFYPLVENGQTRSMRLTDSPYFPIVKALLESDRCKGVVTHMRSTAEMVSALFASETIRAKVHYAPLGVKLPDRWQRHEEECGPIDLLFINSWCQIPENFYVRGGLDVLEAFAALRERHPRLRLTLRTNLPDLDPHYRKIIEAGWVRVIDRFLTPAEMEQLLAESHVFLLPAARIHILSLLQALAHGLAVVTSDGWGMEEYVAHDRTGLVVRGRYGKTSWVDPEASMLRENYDSMYAPDPVIVRGLVAAVSRLVEEPGLRRRLGRAAREEVRTNFTLERWNRCLRDVFDRALAPAGPGLGKGRRS